MVLGTQAITMPESLTATEVARRFADVLNRVAYRRESFVVVRGKRPLAELRPLPAGTRLADLPAILAALPRLEPSEADAFAADLAAAGERIGRHDPWLAATCIAHGLTLITANVREFARVPGPRLETWRDG